MGWSGAAKEPGPGEVLVVDDDVGQGTGPDLGQVDLPGGVVAVPVQAARFAGAFPRGVAGDARAMATAASVSSQMRYSQQSLYSGRNANTESTIRMASAGGPERSGGELLEAACRPAGDVASS